MDVTCDRCKAEYEFDEALLGEKGTTVKCSACGHVFRVMPPSRESARSQLRLRYAKDGSVHDLGSLRELQQRIRAGEVSLDDELGRDGFPFRALRDVPELKNFFARSPEKTTAKPEQLAMASAPTEAARTAPARAPFDEPPVTAKMKPEMLLGALATDRPTPVPHVPPPVRVQSEPSPRAPSPARAAEPSRRAPAERAPADPRPAHAAHAGEPKPAAARTQRAAVPPSSHPPSVEAVAMAAPKQPHRTIMGVGPSGGEPARGGPPRESANATLGPTAAMARANDGRGAHPAPSGQLATDRPPAPAKGHVQAGARSGGAIGPSGPTLLGGPPGRDFGLNGQPAPSGPAYPPAPTAATPRAASAGTPPQAGFEHAPTVAGSAAPAPPAGPRFPIVDSQFPGARDALPRYPVSDGARTVEPSGSTGPAPVRLYVDDEDAPPSRASGGSSKVMMMVLLLLALAGGGWIAFQKLQQSDEPAAPSAAVVPEPAAPAPASSEEAGVAAASSEPAAEPAATPPASGENAGEPAKAALDQPGAEQPAPEDARKAEQAKADGDAKEPKAKDKQSAKAEPERESRSSRSRSSEEPDDYGGWVARGDQLVSRGDQAGAGKAYRAALALRPTGSEANAGLGFALLGQGQARDALPFFDRAANSGYAEANIGLGDAYRKLGQNSSAVEAYESYLERLPSGSRAAYARGWIDKLGKRGGSTPVEHNSYRPAGELNEPSPSEPAPAPAPAEPSEPPQ